MPRFEASRMAELVDAESKLRAQRNELSHKMADMQASDTPWDEPRTAEYQRMAMEHSRVSIDESAAHRERVAYEGRAPKNVARSEASPLTRFLRRGTNGLEESERKLFCQVDHDEAAAIMGGNVEGFRLELSPPGMPTYGRPQAASASDGATAQETVQETVPPRVIDTLAYYGGVAQMAQQFMTSTGNEWRMPQQAAAAEEGVILAAQNADVGTEADGQLENFGVVTFAARTASSRPIYLTRELVQDAVFDIQMYAERQAVRRLGRAWNKAFTTNAVNTRPVGIVPSATVHKSGAAGAFTWDDTVELEYSVNRAYREGMEGGDGGFPAEGGGMIGYMASDAMERALRVLKDSEGRPLWIPSIREGAPGMFNGWPLKVNGHMAAPAANAVPLLFGNFSYYGIRTVQSVEIFRFMDSRTMQRNALECLALSRRDGRPMGAVNANTVCEAYAGLQLAA